MSVLLAMLLVVNRYAGRTHGQQTFQIDTKVGDELIFMKGALQLDGVTVAHIFDRHRLI